VGKNTLNSFFNKKVDFFHLFLFLSKKNSLKTRNLKTSIKAFILKLKPFYKKNKRKFWILTSVCFAVFALLFLVLFSAADTKTKSKSTSTNIPYLQDSCI